jgi:hypothetical protein
MVPVTMPGIVTTAGFLPLPRSQRRPRLVRPDLAGKESFGDCLMRKCAEMLGKFGRDGLITVSCEATREPLPRAMAIQLNLIASELLANAFAVFERNRGGRIGVVFHTGAKTLELTVEHSRPLPQAAACPGVAESGPARTLVARRAARNDHAIVTGGGRTTVSLPWL